jgi:peptide/nickel transport system permease protein
VLSKALLAVLAALHIAVLFAGFFAPYDSHQQYREFSYAPPTPVHWIDSGGRLHLRPFVYRLVPKPEFAGYEEDRTRLFPLCFFCRTSGGDSLHLFEVSGPAHLFLAGTDAYGRDVLSRLLFGGRISLASGLLGAFIAVALGTAIGAIAGYYGKWLDESAMALAEIFLSVPWLYLLLVVRALLPPHIESGSIFVLLVAVLGVVGWARPARLVRGLVLSLKRRVYVTAARGFGASGFYLLRRHILPGAGPVIATQLAWYVPQFMLAEVTLSFFGLGVSEPAPSWGNMLAALQRAYVLQSCWWLFAPAIVIVLVFAGYRQIFARYAPGAPEL